MDEKLILSFEDELVDSKHAKSKPVTKARTRTRKITKYLAKKTNEDEDTIKALLDNDDDFDNIDIKILDNAISENYLEKESRDTPSKNVKECQQSPVIERPLTELTERPLKCFGYIPPPKLSNTEIAAKTLETSLANTLDAVKDSILGEQISDKDPAAAGNEIIQQLFENKHQLEEDFINSQISKDTAVERSDNSILIVDGNDPEELKTHKYSGQITAGGDKFEEAERISNENLGLGNCSNANAVSVISDSLTESENNPSNQLKIKIEESKRNDCSFTMKDSNKNNWKVENIDRISPGKPSTTRNSPEQQAVSDQTSTSNIKRQIPSSKTEYVTIFSKLKNLHNPKRLPYRSLTPAARSVGLVKEDYLNMRSKSCYFKDKAVKSLQPGFRKNSSEITLDSRDTKVPNWKDLKDFQAIPSQSKTVSTIFQNPKLNQSKVSGDQIISVFNQLCDKYLGKENVNSKTKDFLKKIEEELSSENETNMETSRRISEFLDKIAVDKEHLQHKSLNQPSSTVISEKHDPVIRQPLFNKVLSYKKGEHPRTEKAFTKLTNPENDRIDKLLENVIQEPKNHLPPQKCNPYRMKIPKRQRNINMGCASKQNFEYFENLKRKADLEELNRTFSNRSDRNETYLSEMSRIMFADRKKVKLGNEGNYLNIAALPKPDFKAIEEEQLRRSIVAEISGECIPNPNPVKKFEVYIGETDRGLTNLFEGFEDLSYENEIGFKLPEQTNFDFFGENCQQVGFDPSFFQTSSFVSPSEFSDNRVDTFQLPCFNTDIKSEPVSQSFEPLSLLNDTEDDDMLLNYVQVKSEATERDIIDLTSPVIGGSAYTPFSVGSSQDTIDKELFAQFEDDIIFE
ncbi:uncharacterized protein LOC119656920 [Hermetia illucens]|nr:uncharacterized protein LOC119656920 [Hermetia illucens]